jgi:pimeloyl-ACP methyl ester carboxylesterase
MGCRVVVEAAVQAPDHTAGVVLVDGSQFAATMAPVLRDTFATSNGYANLIRRWFEEMFTGRSNPTTVASVINRAESPTIDRGWPIYVCRSWPFRQPTATKSASGN